MTGWEAEDTVAEGDSVRRRRRPRWWPVIPLGTAALLVAILVTQKPSTPLVAPPNPPPTVASTTVPTSTSTAGSRTAPTNSSTPTATRTGVGAVQTTGTAGPTPQLTRMSRPLLGIAAGWELFAATDDGLVRVEPAAGRVTFTGSGEPLGNEGPLQLVVGQDSVLAVVQGGELSGVMVHDGEPAEPLPKALTVEPVPMPGPKPGQWWVTGRPGSVTPVGSTARLVTANGREAESSLSVPSGPQRGSWLPDGRGGLLYLVPDGIYRVGPDGASRISTGILQARGGTRLLMADCDEQLRCGRTMIDLDTGARQPVPGTGIPDDYWIAGLSDDGALAVAVPQNMLTSRNPVVLADLRTGKTRTVRAPIDPSGWPSVVALSPDHAWLFLIGDEGKLRAFDTATGTEHPLGLDLPPVRAIAIRPATS